MRVKALEIRWHDTQPIFSTDFQSTMPEKYKSKVKHPYSNLSDAVLKGEENLLSGEGKGEGVEGVEGGKEGGTKKDSIEKVWRLATAGGDKFIRLWLVKPRPTIQHKPLVLPPAPSSTSTSSTSSTSKPSTSNSNIPPPSSSKQQPKANFDLIGNPIVEYLATLKQHTGVVNVVRFAPFGETLASAGDDGNILFWIPGEASNYFGESADERAYEKESWRVKSMLRTRSGQEIYDVAWSPDGNKILVGSVDHTASIYDVLSGQLIHTIAEHTNYVQGVAWDPRDEFIATQSSDRSMHIYSLNHSTSTGGLQVQAVGKNARMDIRHTSSSSQQQLIGGSSGKGEDKESGKGKGSKEGKGKGKAKEILQPIELSDSESTTKSESSSSVIPPSLPTTATKMEGIEMEGIEGIEELNSTMDPPPFRPSSSRNSSTSGSQTFTSNSNSTSNTNTTTNTNNTSISNTSSSNQISPSTTPINVGGKSMRSPSPASASSSSTSLVGTPLPAVRLPPSPTLFPSIVGPSTATSNSNSKSNSKSTSSTSNSNNNTSNSTTTSTTTNNTASNAPNQITSNVKLYGDASSCPFFRRLTWSTDGNLLLTPAGLFEDPYANISSQQTDPLPTSSKKSSSSSSKSSAPSIQPTTTTATSTGPKPTVYIYSRSNVSKAPIAHLPGHKTMSIAIRFCPILLELRELKKKDGDVEEVEGEESCTEVRFSKEGEVVKLNGDDEEEVVEKKVDEDGMVVDELEIQDKGKGKAIEPTASVPIVEKPIKEKVKPESLFDLPYRMVYAVATLDSVILYDTQQAGPICMFGNLHYAPFTDLSWSADGETLIISSQDGYCSIVAFDPLELGTPYTGKSPLLLQQQLRQQNQLQLQQIQKQKDEVSKNLNKPVASSSGTTPAVVPTTVSQLDLTNTTSVAGGSGVNELKREAEPVPEGAEASGEGQPKKKKRAGLIHHGPLGSGLGPAK